MVGSSRRSRARERRSCLSVLRGRLLFITIEALHWVSPQRLCHAAVAIAWTCTCGMRSINSAGSMVASVSCVQFSPRPSSSVPRLTTEHSSVSRSVSDRARVRKPRACRFCPPNPPHATAASPSSRRATAPGPSSRRRGRRTHASYAQVFLIGEAGRSEDSRTGRSFPRPARRFLDRALADVGL